MQSENTQATDTDQPDGGAGDVANLNDLLVHELADSDDIAIPSDDGDQGAAAGDGDKNAALGTSPEMFNDLAESLGVELDDLYKMKVTTTDGEHKTVEELKALASKEDDIVLRELEFEETRTSKEAALRQAQTELAEIVQGLPKGSVKPAVLERMRARNAERVESEQRKTLDAIPTWRDDKTREVELQGMAAHLERFGLPADYLTQLVDHRMLQFVRESYLREKRINAALEKVRAGKPNPTTTSKTTGTAPNKSAASRVNKNARNKLEAFFDNV